MTTMVFKASCPDCKESFELVSDRIRLVIGRSSKTTFYSFTCPDCGESVRKPAGERIVELLTDGGVATIRLHSGQGRVRQPEGRDAGGDGPR